MMMSTDMAKGKTSDNTIDLALKKSIPSKKGYGMNTTPNITTETIIT